MRDSVIISTFPNIHAIIDYTSERSNLSPYDVTINYTVSFTVKEATDQNLFSNDLLLSIIINNETYLTHTILDELDDRLATDLTDITYSGSVTLSTEIGKDYSYNLKFSIKSSDDTIKTSTANSSVITYSVGSPSIATDVSCSNQANINDDIIISWTSPSSLGSGYGVELYYYTIQIYNSLDQSWSTVAKLYPTTSSSSVIYTHKKAFTDNKYKGHTYKYRIITTNTGDYSSTSFESDEGYIVLLEDKPTPPSELNIQSTEVEYLSPIILSWRGAQSSQDHTIVGYRFYLSGEGQFKTYNNELISSIDYSESYYDDYSISTTEYSLSVDKYYTLSIRVLDSSETLSDPLSITFKISSSSSSSCNECMTSCTVSCGSTCGRVCGSCSNYCGDKCTGCYGTCSGKCYSTCSTYCQGLAK